MNENLTGLTVSNTYHRLVQVIDGKYYDGLGNPLDIGSASNILINPYSINGGTPSSSNGGGVFKIDLGGVT